MKSFLRNVDMRENYHVIKSCDSLVPWAMLLGSFSLCLEAWIGVRSPNTFGLHTLRKIDFVVNLKLNKTQTKQKKTTTILVKKLQQQYNHNEKLV